MDLVAYKLLAAFLLFVLAVIGGFLALKVQQRDSPTMMHFAFAFAGGILIAVAVVHMLADGSDELADVSVSFSKTFGAGSSEAFPLGNTLFIFGFALITSIEALSHKILGNVHKHNIVHISESVTEEFTARVPSRSEVHAGGHLVQGTTELSVTHDPTCSLREAVDIEAARAPADASGITGGMAALLGLSFHSVVEGIAAGSGGNPSTTGLLLVAISIHKGFAAFVLAATNISLLKRGKKRLWILLVLWFALSGSIGIIIGMAASTQLEGAGTGAITCLAGGTLMSVGITELLLPAIQNEDYLVAKLLLFVMSLSSMSFLAVWA